MHSFSFLSIQIPFGGSPHHTLIIPVGFLLAKIHSKQSTDYYYSSKSSKQGDKTCETSGKIQHWCAPERIWFHVVKIRINIQSQPSNPHFISQHFTNFQTCMPYKQCYQAMRNPVQQCVPSRGVNLQFELNDDFLTMSKQKDKP